MLNRPAKRRSVTRTVGAHRVPIHDHSDIDSGGKLAPGAALQGGLSSVPGGGGGTGLSDHGALGGLADDDHPQYENDTAGGNPESQDHGTAGATETVDAANGNHHRLTLDQNCIVTVAPFADGSIELVVYQDGTGGWDLTWSGVDFGGGDDQPDQTASSATVFTFLSDDGNVYGFKAGGSGGGSEPIDQTEVWMPLTSVDGDEPVLVWDGDDSLIPTLVALD
jgi:hypothetical protein